MKRQKLYIVVAQGFGKGHFAGKPIAATFGVFLSQREAMVERDRLAALPSDMIHFGTQVEWIISQDEIVFEN